MYIRNDKSVIYIDKEESNRTLRMFSQIGKRAMLHCTGVGKALLSGLTDEQIKTIINQTGLTKFTENTIVSMDDLFKEIETIRSNEYALDKIGRASCRERV